jgi:hypothetical protein
MTDVPNPVEECEGRLRAILAGRSTLASQDEASRALDDARRNLDADGLDVGVALIKALGRGSGDWFEFVYAITDGEREAAVMVQLSGTQAGTVENKGVETVEEHVIGRLRGIIGQFPSSSDRYLNLIAYSPVPL